MTLYVGQNAALGIGLETTYGTPVSRTAWLSLVSAGLRARQQITPRSHLRRGTGGLPVSHYAGRKEVGGPAEVELTTEGVGLLLYAAMGGRASSGSGPYAHTFSLADELPSLTLEVVRGEGRHSASAEAEVFAGCVINSLTLRAEAHSPVRLSFEALAQDSGGRVSAGTPSYAGGQLLHADQITTATWGGTDVLVRSIEVTLDNGHGFRDRTGAATTARPTRTNDRSAVVRITMDYAGPAFEAALHAGTTGDLVIGFVAGDDELQVTLHNCRVTECDAPVQGAGVISQSVTLAAQADGTDRGLAVVLTNSQSSSAA